MRYHSAWGSLRVFLQFVRRDALAHMRAFWGHLYDYAIVFPVFGGLSFGYLQANVLFGRGESIKMGTIVFTGTIILALLVVTFKRMVGLLIDLTSVRFIDYQITVLNPRLVLLSRVFFATLYTFFMLSPYYFVAKLVLGNKIDTSNTHWPSLFLMLFMGALCTTCYHLMAMCLLPSTRDLRSLWTRGNHVMISFGGLFIPLAVMYAFAHPFGFIFYANPMVYVSDGLRRAVVGGSEFLSLSICVPALAAFSLLFLMISFYLFKRRTDHI